MVRRLAKPASAVLSIALVLLVGELVVRCCWTEGYELDRQAQAANDERLRRLERSGSRLLVRPSAIEELGYEMTPGASGRAWKTTVRINSHGLRGPETSREGMGGFRIAVVGDSITFGLAIAEEQTFAHRLGVLLGGDPRQYEVLNFGVGGYDVAQYAALVEHRAVGFAPRLVVIGFCLNDVGIASPNREYLLRAEAYRQSWLYELRLSRWVFSRWNRLALQRANEDRNRPDRFAQEYADRIDAIGSQEEELLRRMREAPAIHPTRWYREHARIGRIRSSFRRLRDLARTEGFRVVVVVFPWLETLPDGSYPHRTAHEIVAHEARRAGFDTLDVLPAFEARPFPDWRVHPGNPVHFGADGHQVVASALRDYVLGLPEASR